MKKIDKIIFVVLGLCGTIVEVIKFLLQYSIGLIWVVYCFIRKLNYKARFEKLNSGAKKEIKWIIDDFTCYPRA